MGLSTDLLSQFAKVTNSKSQSKKETSTVYGEVVEGGVKLDGSDIITPASSTVDVTVGDRVIVMIKNHSATITGNLNDPSASSKTLAENLNGIKSVSDKITELDIAVAKRVTTEQLNAEKANITNELIAADVIVKDELTATIVNVERELTAKDVEIEGRVSASEGEITKLKANKLDAEAANITYATISNLGATNAEVNNLKSTHADFENATASKFESVDANIVDLDTKKLDAESAKVIYANIDFSNIGRAAIEALFSKSGMISDLVVGDGTITGKLVGVTISGDLIEGNTVKADKLVVKGSDGLYYKLNIDAGVTASEKVTESDLQNGLHGSTIIAKTITATQISVQDLVAFGATIGGFHISESSLYSGVKSTVDNTTRGTYLDSEGQMAVGDATNFIKYYKDTNGNYKLEISASSITLGSKSVDAAISDVQSKVDTTIASVDVEYYLSNSTTELSGGSWSTTAPQWANGKYMWSRTKTTLQNGTTTTSDPTCIAGAKGDTGEQGIQGPKGDKGDAGSNGQTSYFHIKYSSVANPTSSSQMSETPNTYIGTYVDFVQADSTDPSKYTWSQFKGSQGAKGDQGIAGTNGTNGQTSYLHIAYANDATGTSGFSVSDSANKSYIGQYTDFTSTDSTDPTKYSWTKIKGETGATGSQGATGATGPQGPKGDTGAKGDQGEKGQDGAKGDTGATGTGIASITEEYYVSTSKTSQTGGSWSTTTPTWSSGKYIWTRSKIVYKDPTSTVYTTPVCDSSWEAVNEIEVGGRNLVPSTSSEWKEVTVAQWNGTVYKRTHCSEFGLKVGDTFTFSVELEVINKSGLRARVDLYSDATGESGKTAKSSDTIIYKGDIGYSSVTTTVQEGKEYIWLAVQNYDTTNDTTSVVERYRHLKLEKGNKATDWSPAPEDMATADSVDDAKNVAEEAKEKANDAQALIKTLSDSIAMLVTDGNGTSLMTQTEDGWTFSTDNIQKSINATSESLSDLQTKVGDTSNTVDLLKQAVDDLGILSEYVKITTYEGEPCIELGEGDSDFKLLITNTRIMFKEGSATPAYITNQSFHIKKGVIEEELQQGGFVWKARSNGNLGLTWRGGTS